MRAKRCPHPRKFHDNCLFLLGILQIVCRGFGFSHPPILISVSQYPYLLCILWIHLFNSILKETYGFLLNLPFCMTPYLKKNIKRRLIILSERSEKGSNLLNLRFPYRSSVSIPSSNSSSPVALCLNESSRSYLIFAPVHAPFSFFSNLPNFLSIYAWTSFGEGAPFP